MLLIDGYNLLFASHKGRIQSNEMEASREKLIDRVARYCERRGTRARIVFDHTKGPPVWGIPGRTKSGPVEVLYTPQGVIADDEILGMVEKTGDRTSFTLVTNDRGIADVVRKRRFRVLGSEAFLSEMEKEIESAEGKSDDPREKTEGLPPGEVDYWMKEFGIDE